MWYLQHIHSLFRSFLHLIFPFIQSYGLTGRVHVLVDWDSFGICQSKSLLQKNSRNACPFRNGTYERLKRVKRLKNFLSEKEHCKVQTSEQENLKLLLERDSDTSTDSQEVSQRQTKKWFTL